ncbi:MAG TPA: hypothetical protein VN229_10865 [Terriglobales bacterium]|nr:hypothetical protein [Terriglobales bacterium]
MRRTVSAALPLTLLLLAACSDQPVTQKADLRQAADAAKIAGEAETKQKYAPLQLGPSKQAVVQKPAAAPAPLQPTVNASQAAHPATTAAAPATAQPVIAQPVTVPSKVAQPTIAQPTIAQAAITQPIAAGPAPSPDNAPSVQPAQAVDKTPVNGTAIHLASYREIASAQRGWQILSKNYRELAPLQPLYVAVDVPGKGHVLRLYGTGADSRALKEICHEMQVAGAYCADNIAF